ncbi:MAG: hydrogenase 3 maturation endopeptidase HyCI [Candidatus Bipolaricaulaceae bacterium]
MGCATHRQMPPARPWALLGLGNPLGRDDAVGLWVAEELVGSCWTVFRGGTAPENVVGKIARLRPAKLVIVDAADMGLPAGSFRRLPLAGSATMLTSTHGLPLTFLLGQLTACSALSLVGVQPGALGLGQGLTPEVQAGARELVALLAQGEVSAIPVWAGAP